MKQYEFENGSLLAQSLAQTIGTNLTDAILKKGSASLAVSGGKTPIPLFQALSELDLEWDKVFITLVDDRWVDEQDPASNERLVKTILLQNKAQKAHFTGLKTPGNSPFGHEKEVAQKLAHFPFPLDVIVLGMGDDGHTASLFPHAADLKLGLDMHSGHKVTGMTPLDAPHDRITLTLPVILASQHIYLHLSGAQKLAVLEKAIQGNDIEEMPIRAVIQNPKTELQVYCSK